LTPTRLVLEPAQREGEWLWLAARLVDPDGSSERLWWKLPVEWADAVTSWADPWVVGLLFPIMKRGRPVHVEGCVSPSLLANLELFMKIWEIWRPGVYRATTISAEEEHELPPVPDPGLTIASFSCGVDSSFTIYRHARKLAGRRTRPLAAGVFQHGFDIWLDQKNSQAMYDALLAGARTMLASLHELKVKWGDSWGTQLASGLMLFAGRYDTGMVANDIPYEMLQFKWTSHPVLWPLLSSMKFSIVDDGGEYTRVQKAQLLSEWPEAMQHLRVCFGVDIPGRHENCCRCEKCARTMLAFRIAGCPRPVSFKEDVSDAQIRAMRWKLDPLNATQTARWEQLMREAVKAGLGETSWVRAIRIAVRRNRWRWIRDRWQRPFVPLRNAVRLLVRGSVLSRRELAQRRQAKP
jgi:hypothetical protein